MVRTQIERTQIINPITIHFRRNRQYIPISNIRPESASGNATLPMSNNQELIENRITIVTDSPAPTRLRSQSYMSRQISSAGSKDSQSNESIGLIPKLLKTLTIRMYKGFISNIVRKLAKCSGFSKRSSAHGVETSKLNCSSLNPSRIRS